MLNYLKIKNIALIDELSIEFGEGLNLLTGETGSGKSIIVDSLGALAGERISSDLIRQGSQTAAIEGLFSLELTDRLQALLDENGIDTENTPEVELIVRRDLSSTGKNRVFINGQLVTQGFLQRIGPFLVDIHGQGEQAALYDVSTHRELLDELQGVGDIKKRVAAAHGEWVVIANELAALKHDESEKLQLTDILRFQINEISSVNLEPGEEAELEQEKLRLSNIEKLTTLSADAFSLLYDNAESTTTTLDKASRKVEDLSEYEPRFGEYKESLATARAVIEDLSFALRDFQTHLEFSPHRLTEIEDRLAEIARVSRKYGGSVEAALEHLRESEERLGNIESAEQLEEELRFKLNAAREKYVKAAAELHNKRVAAGKEFGKRVVENLKAVALDKAAFEVRISADETNESSFTARGFDDVEFYFSANPGEPLKPLSKVASGGEASRLMLILKTTAQARTHEKTAVFDEVDVGIGGRVADAVGRKLKDLSATQQVLCVTHQPQIASLADRHFVVEKHISQGRTGMEIKLLSDLEQVEEIARMLAGEHITDAARENARTMLASAR